MKSFDVFDTLIGRRFINNDNILEEVQRILNIHNFVNYRKAADTGKRNIFEIYESMVQSQLISKAAADEALELEYSLEISNSFPIIENIKKVNHGDLLISDMYLTGPMILEMVRSAGLDKQVTIYQSNRDKHTGKLWEKLKSAKFLHLGDNKRSDYDVPISFGINSELYPGTHFTDIESEIAKSISKSLSCLMREVRLRLDNTFSTNEFLTTATQFNLPALIILCELINRTYLNRSIVFLGRDCQLLQKIYSTFYKNTNSVYLPFSRKIAFSYPELCIEYIDRHCPANSVLFDLNSTGTTWSKLSKIKKIEVGVAIFLNDQQYLSSTHPLPDSFSYITKNNRIVTNIMYELLNLADHGSISSLSKLTDGVIVAGYDHKEVPDDIISDIHQPVLQAIALSKFYKELIRSELSSVNTETLIDTYRSLVLLISKSSKKLGPHVQPLLEKERQHIRDLNLTITPI
jgi:hypothetical protein